MKIALKYGLIYSGINILWSLLLYVTEFNRSDNANIFQFLTLGFAVVCIVMAVNEFKRTEGNGFITFGNAFRSSLVISLIGGITGAAFMVLFVEVIDPSFKDFILQKQMDQMAEMGMSEDAVEQAIENAARYQTPFWMFTWGVMGSLLMGVIISLIMGAILKKPDPNEIS